MFFILCYQLLKIMNTIVTLVLMLIALVLWILYGTTKKVKIQYPLIANAVQIAWLLYTVAT